MTTPPPTLEDYVRLFEPYGEDMSKIYLQPNDQRYLLVFEQAVRLLAASSPFNSTLPKPFCVTAQKYLAGDERTVRHMNYPENQHFMLSDLYDYITLQARF